MQINGIIQKSQTFSQIIIELSNKSFKFIKHNKSMGVLLDMAWNKVNLRKIRVHFFYMKYKLNMPI